MKRNSPDHTKLSTKDYVELNFPVYVEKDADTGKMYVTGIASDTLEDRDKERLSEKALTDARDYIKKGLESGETIWLLPSHRASFRVGDVVDSDVSVGERQVKSTDGSLHDAQVFELFIKACLRDNHPDAIELYENKDKFQMSLGFFIDRSKSDAVYYEKTFDGKKRRVVNRILLDHIAVTRKNWAANQRARFESAFMKGVEVPSCDMSGQLSKWSKEWMDSPEPTNDKELDQNSKQTPDDVTKEQDMDLEKSKSVTKEELLAKSFGGRFKNTLDTFGSSSAKQNIEEDTIALKTVNSDLSQIFAEREKAGIPITREEVQELVVEWAKTGEILKSVMNEGEQPGQAPAEEPKADTNADQPLETDNADSGKTEGNQDATNEPDNTADADAQKPEESDNEPKADPETPETNDGEKDSSDALAEAITKALAPLSEQMKTLKDELDSLKASQKAGATAKSKQASNTDQNKPKTPLDGEDLEVSDVFGGRLVGQLDRAGMNRNQTPLG